MQVNIPFPMDGMGLSLGSHLRKPLPRLQSLRPVRAQPFANCGAKISSKPFSKEPDLPGQ